MAASTSVFKSLFCCVLLLAAVQSKVTVTNSTHFRKDITAQKYAVVMHCISADLEPKCGKAVPIFYEVARLYKPPKTGHALHFFEIDGMEAPEIITQNYVVRYPQIQLFRTGRRIASFLGDYDRSAKTLLKEINEYVAVLKTHETGKNEPSAKSSSSGSSRSGAPPPPPPSGTAQSVKPFRESAFRTKANALVVLMFPPGMWPAGTEAPADVRALLSELRVLNAQIAAKTRANHIQFSYSQDVSKERSLAAVVRQGQTTPCIIAMWFAPLLDSSGSGGGDRMRRVTTRYFYDGRGRGERVVTPAVLRTFLHKFQMGSLRPMVRSEVPPSLQQEDASTVVKVVGTTLVNFARNPDKDILIMFFNPSDKACRAFMPEFAKLAQFTAADSATSSNLRLGQLDVSRNDVKLEVVMRGLPTLVLFPAMPEGGFADGGDMVVYSGDLSHDALLAFLQQRTTHTVEISVDGREQLGMM